MFLRRGGYFYREDGCGKTPLNKDCSAKCHGYGFKPKYIYRKRRYMGKEAD